MGTGDNGTSRKSLNVVHLRRAREGGGFRELNNRGLHVCTFFVSVF